MEGSLSHERVLMLSRENPEVCDPAPDWALQIQPDRIAIGTPHELARYLKRAADTSSAAELAEYERFASGRVASALLFTPPGGQSPGKRRVV